MTWKHFALKHWRNALNDFQLDAKFLLRFCHFIILKFEYAEYLRKIWNILKYIENSDFFEEYIHFAPISELCIILQWIFRCRYIKVISF